jgi:prophage regulatory protein
MSDHPQERIIRLPELMTITGMSRSTIYARMAEGGFPAPKKLGARAVGWIASQVDAFIAALPSARTNINAAAPRESV